MSKRPDETRVRDNARAAHSALMSVLAELYNTGMIGWDERNRRAEQSYQASIALAETVLGRLVAAEPWCNHDAVAVVNGVCECGHRVAETSNPEVIDVVRESGIAGRVTYVATVRYSGSAIGESDHVVKFVGVRGAASAPVVMIGADGAQAFVTEPARFGPFGKAWVRQFFA